MLMHMYDVTSMLIWYVLHALCGRMVDFWIALLHQLPGRLSVS